MSKFGVRLPCGHFTGLYVARNRKAPVPCATCDAANAPGIISPYRHRFPHDTEGHDPETAPVVGCYPCTRWWRENRPGQSYPAAETPPRPVPEFLPMPALRRPARNGHHRKAAGQQRLGS